MPGFKRKRGFRRFGRRKGVKRRRFKVRRRIRKVSSRINRGFPRSMYITQKYFWVGTVTAGAAATGVQTFRLNSLQDPDYTGAGQQPLYHDELANLYDNYEVIDTKTKVTFLPNDTDSLLVGSTVHEGTTAPATMYQAVESPHSKHGTLDDKNRSHLTYWHKCKPMNFLRKAGHSGNVAVVGSNPTDVVYLTLWVANYSAAATAAVRCSAVIYFRVKWSQPKQPAQS